jgi:hypothetical protein
MRHIVLTPRLRSGPCASMVRAKAAAVKEVRPDQEGMSDVEVNQNVHIDHIEMKSLMYICVT